MRFFGEISKINGQRGTLPKAPGPAGEWGPKSGLESLRHEPLLVSGSLRYEPLLVFESVMRHVTGDLIHGPAVVRLPGQELIRGPSCFSKKYQCPHIPFGSDRSDRIVSECGAGWEGRSKMDSSPSCFWKQVLDRIGSIQNLFSPRFLFS